MPWATVFGNVFLPLKLAGLDRAAAAPRVMEALARVGLADFADAYPRELSGGMKMRVSIARALVTEPRVLLMDEPFAALDEITRFKLNDDLMALWRELGMTVVFVTHSVFESVYLSQRIVVMTPRPGRVFTELTIDAPYPRDAALPHLGGIRRRLPAGLRGARAHGDRRRRRMNGDRSRRMHATAPSTRCASVLPVVVLALGVLVWDLVVRVNDIPPYILPGPGLVLATLVADWPILWSSLLATLETTLRASRSR